MLCLACSVPLRPSSIMFKTQEEINSRLSSKNNLVNRFSSTPNKIIPGAQAPALIDSPTHDPTITVIPLEQPGNKEKPKLSKDQRNEIAFRARVGEGQKVLAAEFGVSQSAIGEIEQGRTKVNENLVQSRIDEVQDVAMQRLLQSLGFITPEKMEKAKISDIANVASSMSKIVSNIRGKDSDAPKVIVQIYAPELKSESSFRTIEV